MGTSDRKCVCMCVCVWGGGGGGGGGLYNLLKDCLCKNCLHDSTATLYQVLLLVLLFFYHTGGLCKGGLVLSRLSSDSESSASDDDYLLEVYLLHVFQILTSSILCPGSATGRVNTLCDASGLMDNPADSYCICQLVLTANMQAACMCVGG